MNDKIKILSTIAKINIAIWFVLAIIYFTTGKCSVAMNISAGIALVLLIAMRIFYRQNN